MPNFIKTTLVFCQPARRSKICMAVVAKLPCRLTITLTWNTH